jgi:hypothetical protein
MPAARFCLALLLIAATCLPAHAAPSDQAQDHTVRALAAQLRSIGFTRVNPSSLRDIEGRDAAAVLLAAEHAYWFDVETGMFPNEHDGLLRALASLVAPALDGATFEERAPADDEGPYELVARMDGRTWRVPAENLGDWYDVDAVLRLLDTLIASRKADARLVMLESLDQTAVVVGGTRQAVGAALKLGLIRSGDTGEPAAAGKAFEAEVLESLRGM